MSTEVQIWLKEFKRCLEKKPASVELYTNKSIKPVNHFMLSDNNNTKIECSEHRYGSAQKEDQQAIDIWLQEYKGISEITIGKLVDANYGT